MYALDVDVTAIPTTPWEVIAGVGTLLTAFVALFLGLYENRASGRRQASELQRLEEERNAARAAQAVAEQAEAIRRKEEQARQVALWVADTPGRDPMGTPFTGYEVRVANYSRAVVFDIAIHSDSINGNQVERHPELVPDEITNARFTTALGDDVTFYVTFRDIAGTRWRRFDDGRLTAD